MGLVLAHTVPVWHLAVKLDAGLVEPPIYFNSCGCTVGSILKQKHHTTIQFSMQHVVRVHIHGAYDIRPQERPKEAPKINAFSDGNVSHHAWRVGGFVCRA